MKVTVTSAIVTTILIANAQAWAHHSHANYVESEWLSLEGTVREIHWMNPHSWIYLDVVDADGDPFNDYAASNLFAWLRRSKYAMKRIKQHLGGGHRDDEELGEFAFGFTRFFYWKAYDPKSFSW